MLTAPDTLQDSGIIKKPQKKATKQIASQLQLRPIYEDPQIHETDDKTSEAMDEKDELPVRPIREANHPVLQETSANSRLPQTRTTKTEGVNELVLPKFPRRHIL